MNGPSDEIAEFASRPTYVRQPMTGSMCSDVVGARELPMFFVCWKKQKIFQAGRGEVVEDSG